MLAGALAALTVVACTQAEPSPARAGTSVVLQASGGGNATTAAFTTGSDWSLRFTFACPGSGRFEADDLGDGAPIPAVDESGPADQGTMFYHDVAGTHRIAVTTGCQWTLTATDGDELPRA